MGKKKNRNIERNNEKDEKKKQGRKKRKLPLTPFLIVAVTIIAIGVFAFMGNGVSQELTMADMPALKGNETKPIVSPSRYRGKTASSYNVAIKYGEVLDYMYCYCNCKQSIGHKSLRSCFTDDHAANCGICQDQAFFAAELTDQGKDLAEVRMAEDKRFWRPFR
jgi:hypothetical protein